jgi:hypothetical protein
MKQTEDTATLELPHMGAVITLDNQNTHMRTDKHEAAHEAARKLAEGKEYLMGDIDVPNAELGGLNLPTL